MTPVLTESLIDSRVETLVSQHAQQFARHEPFRHVVIDDFLDNAFAARLLAEFPAFEHGNALNEAGEPGGKSTVERIRDLGPAYVKLDDLIKSSDFLHLVGRLTGIEGLMYDPYYFGGGTHENCDGQELDPHVDFNRHPVDGSHRRLNLIVYLNDKWEDVWGGSLELHSNPRAPDDRTSLITPLYNRCVIFETTESSWHSFNRIALPKGRTDLTRRSIALYFYTRHRPAEELAEGHSTIYVDRPLPERFRAGLNLDGDDVDALRMLLLRRDQHIRRLYRDITALGVQLEEAKSALTGGKLASIRYLANRLRAWTKR